MHFMLHTSLSRYRRHCHATDVIVTLQTYLSHYRRAYHATAVPVTLQTCLSRCRRACHATAVLSRYRRACHAATRYRVAGVCTALALPLSAVITTSRTGNEICTLIYSGFNVKLTTNYALNDKIILSKSFCMFVLAHIFINCILFSSFLSFKTEFHLLLCRNDYSALHPYSRQ